MWQQGDHFTPRRIPLSYKSNVAKKQQLHARMNRAKDKEMARRWLQRNILCHNKNNCAAKQLWRNPCVSGIHPHFLFSFYHSHSLCRQLAEDGDDRMGWIFNRFVSGSTIGGRIIVNIITYRSLPCQTGAITHNSPFQPPPHPAHKHTHITFSF